MFPSILGNSKLYSIDVEFVATGYRHFYRDVARIAIVNAMCEVVYRTFVKPELEVVSYLTPLTGITYSLRLRFTAREEDIKNAPSLKAVMKEIRAILPKDAILVGQGIGHGSCDLLCVTCRHLLAAPASGSGLRVRD